MLINQITEQDRINLQKKFDAFDLLIDSGKPALGYIKFDPSLFAYFFFKDDTFNRFKALPWQDKFLNSKSPRRLLCCSRQIGKSTSTAILALHKAYFNPGFCILVISRTKDQAMELVYRMRKFLNTSRFTIWKELAPKKKENKKEIIIKSQDKNVESRIIVVPATDAALGYSANIVIGDEAARWENGDYVFREVIEPTTEWTNGDIYLLSTPGGKQGFFYEMYNMQDLWEVYHFDYRNNPKNTPERIAIKKRIHTTLSFAVNYEAKFVVSQQAYFSPIEIANAQTVDAGRGYQGDKLVCVGVDFGKMEDKSVIMIGNVLNPEAPETDAIIRVIDRRTSALGTDYATVLNELRAINEKMRPQSFVVDCSNGDYPADILMSWGLPVEKFIFTLPSKVDIMNTLKMLMQQRRLQIPNVAQARELIEQLEMFEYKFSGTNQDRMKLHAPEGYHDDEVDALALMAHGLTNVTYLRSKYISSEPAPEIKQDDVIKEAEKAQDDFYDLLRKQGM